MTIPTIHSTTFRRNGSRDVGQARDAGLQYEVVHLSNSPSALTRPDLAFDMVRPGIAVYGQTPIPERGDMGLKPAMTLKCPVALVRPVKAGDGVSYGHTWIAERDTTLALLPSATPTVSSET